jgi:glycosyltransferase involved in cell wall biosynthesis
MKSTLDVSVVIPTRNRIDSLNRTLLSLSMQSCIPKEIIIVDSSDVKLNEQQLRCSFNQSKLNIIHSNPSVCLQRNIGIKNSTSEYIFLCDDDIEISSDYIENLATYLNKNSSSAIVSGLIYEKRDNLWSYAERKKSFLKLFYAHLFGLSVWTEIKITDYSKNKIIQRFVSYYLKKGNRIAKSGWPIVINYESPCFKTPIYGLGASILKADILKNVLFETSFYEHGIGDNYDLAIGITSQIAVLKDAKAYHHKESINRIKNDKAYYLRVAALHYILLKHKKFTTFNYLFLIWSLIGNSITFLFTGKIRMLVCNFELIMKVLLNQNIYKLKN